jgi:hypothetical protein
MLVNKTDVNQDLNTTLSISNQQQHVLANKAIFRLSAYS